MVGSHRMRLTHIAALFMLATLAMAVGNFSESPLRSTAAWAAPLPPQAASAFHLPVRRPVALMRTKYQD